MKNIFLLALTTAFLAYCSLFSQDGDHSDEINSSLPELSDFHEVIYPIWHKAYPDKNYKMLKEMVADLNAGAEKIYTAQLPGILRDKKQEWEEGVKQFKTSVEDYNKAVNDNNEPEILGSAEKLHSNFEMLVRIVKPVTEEVDEFHKVFYMIFHHYWPEKNTEEFNLAVDNLWQRAEELKMCVLPKWAEEKSEKFKKQSEELFTSTDELKKLKDSNSASEVDIEKAIDKVHSHYQALEALFD